MPHFEGELWPGGEFEYLRPADGRMPAGERALFVAREPVAGAYAVGFADGHARAVVAGEVADLRRDLRRE